MYKPNFQKREVLVFRQFQRKGYSLFACLGREVVISVLSVATLSASKAATISDEVWRTTDSLQIAKEVWLGDVGVTGSRSPLTKSQAVRMVTVLTRDDIQQAAVQSVNDLLKMAVGIDVRQRGALGSQTDISIRGGTQEQITILLNGINICDPQTGHNVMDLPVQLSEIVRIEVLEGPAGRTFGTSSLVGAINIVTIKRGERKEVSGEKGEIIGEKKALSVEMNAEAGSYGYAKASFVAQHSAHRSPFLSQLSGSYARSDGYSRSKAGNLNTDYSGAKGFYQGQYDDGQVSVSWHMGLADKGWGSSTFYASPKWQADEQYEHTTKLLTALQAETKQGKVHFRPAIYWNEHRDRYEGYRDCPDLMKFNYNRCDVYGASLNSWFDSPLGRTSLGAELRNEDLVSTNLGEPLSRTHSISGTDLDYTLGINRTVISAHLEHNVLLKRATLSAGFIATKDSWSGMNMTLYPGIDASYRPNDSWRLFASWNTSLRLPTFTELYYKLQGYAANPRLKPEEMQAVEIGTQLNTATVSAKVALYHHHGTNMIDWIMDTSQGTSAVWQSVNHTKLNSVGLEASTSIDLQTALPSQRWLQRLDVSYAYIHQDKELEAGIVSQYAMEYLRHKLVGNLQMRLSERLTLGLSMRWQDRVGSYTDFSGALHNYKPFALFDARLEWTASHYTFYLKANNLLDNRSYRDYGNVPQPGLWLIAGTKWRL